MLYSLHVKNLALINEQEIEFGEGLNILTGETGAGKSVVIGSVNLALGAKADKELIRNGAEYALIEMSFGFEKGSQLDDIEKMGFSMDEDNLLIIQRKILPNRSICRVNGETVTVRQLRELSEKLINIHGQNDQQSLLHRQKQLEILDAFCGLELKELKSQLHTETLELNRLEKELASSDMDEKTRLREQELAEFELKEIEDAAVADGEDEKLEADYRKMTNSRKISEAVGNARELMGGEESGVSDGISRALREMNSVSGYDPALSDIISQLADIDSLTSDVIRSVDDYMSDIEFNDEDFAYIEGRLNLINHLKDKYGGSIDEIRKCQAERIEQLEMLGNLDAHRQHLAKEIADRHKEALKLCKAVSAMRRERAEILSKQLKKALLELNFNEVKFEVQVTSNEEHIGADGFDDVVFMISTNHGEEMRPLDQVASGGELSRIMLALKTVFADEDDIDTLIFDEIDSGISGRTAWKVSAKLGLLADKRQVVCITHLPQIAAMADRHFMIEKCLENDRTVTHIKKLGEQESINELARMLGGETITEAALQNAREMKVMAGKNKEEGKDAL